MSEKYNLKPLVNNASLYLDFLDYIKEELGKVHKELESYQDPSELYRLQGEARRLRRFMQLKERINNG